MSHQRILVSAVVTLLVAVVAVGSLFAPSRLPQTGRRPTAPARISRIAQRLDPADTTSHDTGYQDPASSIAPHAPPLRRSSGPVVDAGGSGTAPTWAPAPHAVVIPTNFVDAHLGAGLPIERSTAPHLWTHLLRPTAGRAPPGVQRPAV